MVATAAGKFGGEQESDRGPPRDCRDEVRELLPRAGLRTCEGPCNVCMRPVSRLLASEGTVKSREHHFPFLPVCEEFAEHLIYIHAALGRARESKQVLRPFFFVHVCWDFVGLCTEVVLTNSCWTPLKRRRTLESRARTTWLIKWIWVGTSSCV